MNEQLMSDFVDGDDDNSADTQQSTLWRDAFHNNDNNDNEATLRSNAFDDDSKDTPILMQQPTIKDGKNNYSKDNDGETATATATTTTTTMILTTTTRTITEVEEGEDKDEDEEEEGKEREGSIIGYD